VAQFGGSIKNMPEPLRAPTRGRIDYHFKAFEFTAVMFMEVKLNLGAPSDSEWTNAIAHVIAECNGQSVIPPQICVKLISATACNFNNRQRDINIPIYGILCDGSAFWFVSFDGNSKPCKLSMGRDPRTQRQVIAFHDFSFQSTAHDFIHSLRPICEIVFNLLLLSYIASLKVWVPCEDAPSQPGQERISGFDKALGFAEEALKKSQNAEVLRQDNLIAMADVATEAAFQDLKQRYNFS
jgi:hypothetical protein